VIEVAASEFDFLAITRALVDDERGAVAWLLRGPRELTPTFSPQAIDLAQDILGKGWVLTLLRRGGWQRTRFAGDEAIHSGRLWDRHPTPTMRFSSYSMQLCRWLTETELAGRAPPAFDAVPESAGDHLLAFLAVELAMEADCAHTMAVQPGIRRAPLAWLGFADVLGRVEGDLPDFGDLLVGPSASDSAARALVLDALQDDLGHKWAAMERRKRHLELVDRIATHGRAQDRVLQATFDALDRAGRRELCNFVLRAAAIVADETRGGALIGPLDGRAPLAQRTAAYAGAAAFVLRLANIATWIDEARASRFFDEDYSRSQLLLEMWEQFGQDRYLRLSTMALELVSVRALEEGTE